MKKLLKLKNMNILLIGLDNKNLSCVDVFAVPFTASFKHKMQGVAVYGAWGAVFVWPTLLVAKSDNIKTSSGVSGVINDIREVSGTRIVIGVW